MRRGWFGAPRPGVLAGRHWRRLTAPPRSIGAEAVLPPAEFAADLDLAARSHDRIHFLLFQARQHASHALALGCRRSAAGAARGRCTRLPEQLGAAACPRPGQRAVSRVSVAARWAMRLKSSLRPIWSRAARLRRGWPVARHALDHQAGGNLWSSAASTSRVSSCSGLQHAVLQHLRQLLQRLRASRRAAAPRPWYGWRPAGARSDRA